MSVINQMLKDLDQRAPEQGQIPTTATLPNKSSNLRVILITLIVLLSLNGLGFYIWHLQERVSKSELKQTVSADPVLTKQVLEPKSIEQVGLIPTDNELPVIALSALQKTTEEKSTPSKSQIIAVSESVTEKKVAIEQVVSVAPVISDIVKANKTILIAEDGDDEKSTPTKMTVSRRQLTAAELVAQKLSRAEKAVNSNEITKAEQLFEEVLIIEPTHKEARKKLAALWFGRKSYQQALNVLSQGIALDKEDSELRLLKARIFIKQGRPLGAFKTLAPLKSIENSEYQLMLANVAMQVEQYANAIMAYKVLIKMQPFSGRWHLGLAIVYDKDSQFDEAINEYKLALTQADLSDSSAQFALQRVQALGE